MDGTVIYPIAIADNRHAQAIYLYKGWQTGMQMQHHVTRVTAEQAISPGKFISACYIRQQSFSPLACAICEHDVVVQMAFSHRGAGTGRA